MHLADWCWSYNYEYIELFGLNGLPKKEDMSGEGVDLGDLGGGMGYDYVKDRSVFINFSLSKKMPPFNIMLHSLSPA